MCSGSVCCASSTFNADTQFQLLETGVFTYGIETVESSLVEFRSLTDFGVPSYLRSASELMDSMITISPPTTSSNTLKVVTFIVDTSVSTATAPTDSEMTISPLTTDNDVPATTPSSHLSTAIIDPSSTTEIPLDNTTAPSSGGTGGSLPVILGGVVGAMVFVVLLMVAVSVLVVCVLTKRRRSTDKWNPEASAISEQQLEEGSQRRVISGTHSTGTGEEVIEQTEMMSSNPSYMPNTDASINYEGEMYSYIDPEDVRILARNPIVYQDEIKTEQAATSSNIATADNICYGSAIPRDHSDQVTTSDNVAYGSCNCLIRLKPNIIDFIFA